MLHPRYNQRAKLINYLYGGTQREHRELHELLISFKVALSFQYLAEAPHWTQERVWEASKEAGTYEQIEALYEAHATNLNCETIPDDEA